MAKNCVILNQNGEMMGPALTRWVAEYPDAMLMSRATAMRLARLAIRRHGHERLTVVQDVGLAESQEWIVTTDDVA